MYDPTAGYATSILVTGATGSVGRAVARELVVSGYRVYGLVRAAEARDRLPYAVVAVVGDLRDPERWENAIERSQVVVNCAFPDDLFRGPMDREAARRDAERWAALLDRLFDVVRRKKRRLIHTFSALLYEPDAKGWVRENLGINEGRGYGIRQRAAWSVFDRQRKKGLKAMGVCPGFVYGRGGWFEQALLEPLGRGRAVLAGDGTQTMHYVSASDLAAAFRLAIEHGMDGDEYLIADDRPTTLGDFTRLVARELGAAEPPSVPEEDLIPQAGAWNVEAMTTCPKIDSTKARERLGWTPRLRTVEEGVPVVVREYKRALLQAAGA